MTKTLLVIFLLSFGLKSFSQDTNNLTKDSINFNKKYIAWFYPSHATHVYGLNIDFWFKEGLWYQNTYPTINGVDINLNPLVIFTPIMMLLYSADSAFNSPPTLAMTDTINFSKFKQINGIQIALLNMDATIINGLNINAFASRETGTRGVTISLLSNKEYFTNGLTLALFGNHNTKCKGVQLGLVNSCRQLKGIQFGLWNKNQKRSLPLINWCL
ncbi:MAG: hypothetical protein V4620_00660 [Bacteroidota bacterium]